MTSTSSMIHDIFKTLGRKGYPFRHSDADGETVMQEIFSMTDLILSEKGEASSMALAQATLELFRDLPEENKKAFFVGLAEKYGPDTTALQEAINTYQDDRSDLNASRLHDAAEPRRQELIRRLNYASGATATLVDMRRQLLQALPDNAQLAVLDHDFRHLLSSWFNRGFLNLQRITWKTPASILEKIISYEAVHKIDSWDDLRRRLEPPDRRCYAFFHPVMEDEPLIFVEVALENHISDNIADVLSEKRSITSAEQANTAVFYSISNCQKGLRGISFGNFLIKQVVRELSRDLPRLKKFITLSPVPGFKNWLQQQLSDQPDSVNEEKLELLRKLEHDQWQPDTENLDNAKSALMELIAEYLVNHKNKAGFPANPVAGFHLSNGARLEQINWMADTSSHGLEQSLGFMVNYLYDMNHIEKNHEQYINQKKVITSGKVRRLLPGSMIGVLN